MGNTPSSSSKRTKIRSMLEQFTKPTGLYPTCFWDEKTIKKMILDGKIAPRFPGTDTNYQGTVGCPICFLRYCAVNVTSCCGKPICSECYLQVQQPKGSSHCPYCNSDKFLPQYAIPDEDKMIEKEMIMEASEKGNADQLIPLQDSPSEDDGTVLDAHQVYANAPLATVEDRKLIEDEISRQHQYESDSPTRLGGRRSSGGRRPLNRRERHEEMDLRRAILDSLGLPRDLQQVEELMLLEAIRQSMEDQRTPTGNNADGLQPQGGRNADGGRLPCANDNQGVAVPSAGGEATTDTT